MRISSYPKVYNLGHPAIAKLTDGDVSVTEKVDGCFNYESKVVLENGSTERIGYLVNNRIQTNVLSYNLLTDAIEAKPIVAWHHNGSTNDWLKVRAKGSHGQYISLICTPNHLIMKEGGVWASAQSLKPFDKILKRGNSCSEVQRQMMLGSLLGDGYINDKRYRCSHSIKQSSLIELKTNILSSLVSSSYQAVGGYGTQMIGIQTGRSPATNDLYDLCTVGGKKEVTHRWLSQLTPIGLAFWYMDDGSISLSKQQKGYATFHTEGYTREEVETISAFLYRWFGLHNSIIEYRGYYRIALTTKSTDLLFSMIFPYIIPDLQYKLYPEYRTGVSIWQFYNFTDCLQGLVPVEVLDVSKCNPRSKTKFDLTVQNNSNYMVGGVLVHNSQFSMAVIDSELHCRSKNAEVSVNDPGMFDKAVETAWSLFEAELLMPDAIYRCEYLRIPKHNSLAYSRVPKRNLIVFDIVCGPENYLSYENMVFHCDENLGLECVPQFQYGSFDKEYLDELMQRDSVLGGSLVEGLVIKNYSQWGKDGKALMGKYVSERFREVHREEWRQSNPTGKDIIGRLQQKYRTTARWEKALMHLREQGLITDEPKDIGLLIKTVQQDVEQECEDLIKQELWSAAWPHIKRRLGAGLPEWYKDRLVCKQFQEESDD